MTLPPLQGLLEQCSAAGVELTAEGETLRFRARRGALTPDLRSLLSAQKRELLAALRGRDETPNGRCPTCQRPVDEKKRCWHCNDRACERCGRPTSSTYLALCLPCDMLEPRTGHIA
jgi:hypothetical protein